MSELTSQLLLAFLFVIIGFIGGALVMNAWYSRHPPTQNDETVQPETGHGRSCPDLCTKQKP